MALEGGVTGSPDVTILINGSFAGEREMAVCYDWWKRKAHRDSMLSVNAMPVMDEIVK